MTLSPDVNHPAAQGSVPPGQAPAGAAGPKVAPRWIGALMALGGIVAVIGTFLPFEKIVVFGQGRVLATATFTGVGSRTSTGAPISGLDAGKAGVVILVLAALAVVGGLLVLARKGRLWVGIGSLLLTLAAMALCLAVFAAPSSDQKDLNAQAQPGFVAHALGKLGADVTAVGVGVALVAALLAICVRRRNSAVA